MSLNWDVSNIKDFQTVTSDPTDKTKWHPVTWTLVNTSMIVGLCVLDEKTLPEWVWRLEFLKQLNRADFLIEKQGKSWKHRSFTMDELRAHLGLRTNASTLTRKQWVGRQWTIVGREVDALADKALHTLN
jgi:hypothetical protein